jgi:ureidoglycolate lyase
MSRRLAVELLTKAAFAPWGEVIERDGAEQRVINEGTTSRLHALAAVDVGAAGGRPIISIFAGRRRPFPLSIAMLERHPLGSQCFFPLQAFDWLVVVGHVSVDGAPDLRCFRASGRQGVSYAIGAWHHPLLILQSKQDFLVIDRDGPGANCEEIVFPETRIIDVALG